MRDPTRLAALGLTVLAMNSAAARDFNYEEDQVGSYELPDPLTTEAGHRVETPEMWRAERRPELVRLFESEMYGSRPAQDWSIQSDLLDLRDEALGGKAVRELRRITVPAVPGFTGIDMLIYRPQEAKEPVPVMLGLSFAGLQAVSEEADVPVSGRWMRSSLTGVVDNRATEASRGASADRWPVAMALERGYAVAVAYCGDIEPDHAEGWKDGIRGAVAGADHEWKDGEWGCISAWAWGLSRMLDALEAVPEVDASKAVVLGHSRLGKTALWAGATDPRFAVVISNNSGEGGAALKYRDFGETPARITENFPHWFTPTYARYGANPTSCPVDQHQLLALMAPRPVYVASATEDRWADPRGEFLAAQAAEPVFKLLGGEGLGVEDWPEPDQPVGGDIGYHLRTGKHDITAWDWQQYLDFADRHLR